MSRTLLWTSVLITTCSGSLLAQETLLVPHAEDGPRMRDRPLVGAEPEMILVLRRRVRQRHLAMDDDCRAGHERVAAARTIPSARSTMRATPGTSIRAGTSVARW